MIVVMNRIAVAPGFEEAFEERFRDCVSTIAVTPGFLRNETLRPLQGDHYIIKTYWRTREHVERWTRGESFHYTHVTRGPTDMFSGPNVLEIHEIIQETGVLLIPVRGVDWP
jgi:heme-degrading monooxygenase HmoA